MFFHLASHHPPDFALPLVFSSTALLDLYFFTVISLFVSYNIITQLLPTPYVGNESVE
jgi:hypothetical protein